MKLFELVHDLVQEVESLTGNFEKVERIEEKVEYILDHSSIKYDHTGLWLKSYSAIGVKQGKEVAIQVPKYMVFKITEDNKEWKLSTYNTLEQIEEVLRGLDSFEIAVVLIDGVITDYNLIETPFKDRIIWKNPIYQVQYKEKDGEDKSVLISDRTQLDEVIKDKFKQGYKNIQVFNILDQCVENFYLTSVIYSTDGGYRPIQIHWGETETTFLELSGEKELEW